MSIGTIAPVTLQKIRLHFHIKGSFNQGKCYCIVPHWAGCLGVKIKSLLPRCLWDEIRLDFSNVSTIAVLHKREVGWLAQSDRCHLAVGVSRCV